MTAEPSGPDLAAELEDLRARLAETEEVLRAIRNGEVDALLVSGERGEQVYTLSGADRIYRQLIDTMSEGAVTLFADGVILYCNVRMAEMLGRPLDQVLGTALRNYLPPADQQALGAILAQARTEPSRREINLKTSDGRLVPISLSAFRLHSEGAEMVFCLVLTDLTEQKANYQLRQAQKMEALGTLAGGIAHDFNNILGPIIGNIDQARQDVGPSHPAMESIEEIRKASHRAKDLVQRILTFTNQSPEPQSVIPLRPVVEEAVTFLRATLPAGVEVAATVDADAPTVMADSTQIHQVLINLCINAWHAMEGHAGRIDIRLDGITLGAEAARADANLRPGHFARLCVTDTGTGMDAATLERIFEPFFTTKPVGQGTGLGLSVVHGVVKAHDGAITVTSQPGRGTTFSLYFPAVEAPEASAAPEGAAAAPPAGGRHVLYLDDDEPLVFLVTRILERLGYRVSGYTRAEEALAAVRADPGQFDLVVTDLNMPGMSGLDVARELARLRPDLPVVLASGYITEELRAQAPQAGVRQLIYKPNTVEELCAAVQRLAGAPKRP